jgi:hypothetical protein
VQPEALTGKLVGIEKLGEDEHDGKILKVFKARGEFEADVDLSEFPFDKQTLLVPLVDKHSDKYQYHGDVKASGLDPAVKLAGWNVLPKVGVFSMKQEVAPGMVEASTTMGIQVERPRLAAFFKTLAPACFMIFVAAFTLLLRPKSASGRLTAATAGLMSAVMFHAGQTSSRSPRRAGSPREPICLLLAQCPPLPSSAGYPSSRRWSESQHGNVQPRAQARTVFFFLAFGVCNATAIPANWHTAELVRLLRRQNTARVHRRSRCRAHGPRPCAGRACRAAGRIIVEQGQ